MNPGDLGGGRPVTASSTRTSSVIEVSLSTTVDGHLVTAV
jgi:hypothetical protein